MAHLAAEWVRYFALAEMVVLIACFIGLHHGSKAVLPRITYLAGWGILYVLICVATALVINVTDSAPPTVGLQIMSLALAPVAFGGVVVVFLAARENRNR